jgi:RNA polymerase sigma factor (sigma-70 family)
MLDDHQLLRQYAEGSESAFREIVARYVNLVYSTALRQTDGDSQLAQDASQLVFADLARKARSLSANVILAGWLHHSTRFAARQLLRTERRRRQREQQAVTMNAIESEGAPNWEQTRPLLDEALDRLSRKDRDALLLRFFEQRSLAEVGAALGTNEDAACKRVHRALEKLRAFLARRGADTAASTFAVALSSNAVHAAPAAWAATLAGSSLASAANPSASSLAILKLMTITKVKIIGFAVVAIVLTVGVIGLSASGSKQNTARFQIIPGVGVGPVRVGMTLAEVEKVLGKAGPGGIYAPLGLCVLTGTNDPTHVSELMVIGRAADGNTGVLPADLKDFAGATKEGIRLESTGAEVLQALGKPDGSEVSDPGWESLNYHALGLFVDLQDGRVKAMGITKPFDKNTTVALDTQPQDAPSPPVSSVDWMIEPKVGIGPIKFGMTMEEVEKILGKPVQIAHDTKYEYYQDGIILLFGTKVPQRVFYMTVMGTGKNLTVSAAGISYLDFAGATKGGIRIGSDRAAVLQSLGQPRKSIVAAGQEILSYSAQGITVRLENGRVMEMNLIGGRMPTP